MLEKRMFQNCHNFQDIPFDFPEWKSYKAFIDFEHNGNIDEIKKFVEERKDHLDDILIRLLTYISDSEMIDCILDTNMVIPSIETVIHIARLPVTNLNNQLLEKCKKLIKG